MSRSGVYHFLTLGHNTMPMLMVHENSICLQFIPTLDIKLVLIELYNCTSKLLHFIPFVYKSLRMSKGTLFLGIHSPSYQIKALHSVCLSNRECYSKRNPRSISFLFIPQRNPFSWKLSLVANKKTLTKSLLYV